MFKKLIIPIIVVVFVSACSSQETLSVENAWARPGISGGNTAIYFQVNNEAGEQDSLEKVSVSINAKAVEFI